MRLVFCLYKYFPYGGLQRDFLRIALACRARGHQARVLTLAWQGARPPELDVEILCVRGLTGPARYRRFSAAVQRQLASDPADAVIGFNKMPGLDIYYAADPCYAHKAHTQRGAPYRLLPRYRHFARYEAAVFDAAARTQILMLSDLQRPFFVRHYGTPAERFHALPPGIDRSRRAPPDAAAIRAEFRAEFGLGPNQPLLLQIGSGFRTKGLDRVLHGLAALPPALAATQLFVIGQDDPAAFRRLARRLGVAGLPVRCGPPPAGVPPATSPPPRPARCCRNPIDKVPSIAPWRRCSAATAPCCGSARWPGPSTPKSTGCRNAPPS